MASNGSSNTIIKQRHTTMVFKLAARPPDVRTRETIDEGVALTDREVSTMYLDRMYDPASKSYRDLCRRVAEKRLERCGYETRDIRKDGSYTIEDQVPKHLIAAYLRRHYPNKERVKSKFDVVYKDFKTAAVFQMLSAKGVKRTYAGFETFSMLSSGIMVHFLNLP